jgi:hypothetical protein
MNSDESRKPDIDRGIPAVRTDTAWPARDSIGMRQPRAKRPPDSARCAGCGSDGISSVRFFSAGSGVAGRPFAEDVICNGCGHLGPPALVPE